MAPAKILTITKGGDGGFTTNVYAGKVCDVRPENATKGLSLAYTLNRKAEILSISPASTQSGKQAGMKATVAGSVDKAAKICGRGLVYNASRRISSHAWKFTNEIQQKFKWHVDSKGRQWNLRTKSGIIIAKFTNNGPFEDKLGVLEFHQLVSESFTQLALLTWALTRRSLNDYRNRSGADQPSTTTDAWLIDGVYGSNGHHVWYSTGYGSHHHGGGYHHGGGHHHGDHGGGHHHGDHSGWGGDSGGGGWGGGWGGDCGGGGGGDCGGGGF